MESAAATTDNKKRRTKMVRVKQEYIDGLLKYYPFNFKPFPGSPEEIAKTVSCPVIREQLRAMLADAAARVKASGDKDEAILAQYFAKGYAEGEASDDDEDRALEDTAEAPQGTGESCRSKL